MLKTPFVVVWIVLAACTVGLALYRRFLTAHEDDTLHVGVGQEKLIPHQVEVFDKIRSVDHYGKILTVITAAYGLVILGFYLYDQWVKSQLPFGGV